ncbi:MAG: hypothetical protein LBS62_09085 [Clostridiales bacterium]|nr:hypothetical protein [Clostridiales bacterium]
MKTKYRVVAAVAFIILMISAFTGCSGEDKKKAGYAFSFTGNITINDIFYDVVLNGEEGGTFELLAGNIPPTRGTYEFTAGKGYLFKFEDSKENEMITEYDPAAKYFSFVYPLDLGPRGKGNVNLGCKDETFTPDNEGWTFELPVFTGQAVFGNGILTVNLELQCKSDGTFVVHNDSSYAQQIDGTYTCANDIYSFTVSEDFQFESYYDEETGSRSVTFDIAVNNVPVQTTLAERVLMPD